MFREVSLLDGYLLEDSCDYFFIALLLVPVDKMPL